MRPKEPDQVDPIRPKSPMQLSRAADYAVRVMLHLAGLPPGTRVCLTDLATALELPPSFLSKVLQRLQHARLIGSRRGMDGGFYLQADCEVLTVLDIVQVMEGPICLNLCLVSATSCKYRVDCVVHPVWREAQAAMVAVLRSVSIAKLAAQAAARKTTNDLSGAA